MEMHEFTWRVSNLNIYENMPVAKHVLLAGFKRERMIPFLLTGQHLLKFLNKEKRNHAAWGSPMFQGEHLAGACNRRRWGNTVLFTFPCFCRPLKDGSALWHTPTLQHSLVHVSVAVVKPPRTVPRGDLALLSALRSTSGEPHEGIFQLCCLFYK